jgi:hypothetical protein
MEIMGRQMLAHTWQWVDSGVPEDGIRAGWGLESEKWAEGWQGNMGDMWSYLIEILDDSDHFRQKSCSSLTPFFLW